MEYKIISDKVEFQQFDGAKIHYSDEYFENSVQILPTGLLFETEIKPQTLNISEWKGIKTIYPTNAEVPFDLFSAVFYLISRHEEYTDDDKDELGRFKTENSILYKLNTLHQPIVNIWIEEFYKFFISKFKVEKGVSAYKFIATYDIDQPYAYKGKGFLKNSALLLKDFTRISPKHWSKRLSYFFSKKDPYDVYNTFFEENKKTDESIFFILSALKQSQFDRNISPKSDEFKEVVLKIAKQSKIGLHPSFLSHEKRSVLQAEKEILESISTSKIDCSRQHYLITHFPKTFKNLIALNFSSDYSLGFTDEIGFRSGTCTPYFFYDLTANKATELQIFPLNIMDVGLKKCSKNLQDALQKAKELIDQIKLYNGTFCLLWHNSSFCEMYGWEGYEHIYLELMNYAKK